MFYEELAPRHDGYRVVRISPEHFGALCEAIRLDLLEICYGKDRVGLDPKLQTYKYACREISNMLNGMEDKKKIGCIGELIMHLIVPEVFGSKIEPLSVLLSMSDCNIKHGFDLNYYQYDNSSIWYGEVKSGIDQERKKLIKRAEKGLGGYFTGLNKTGKENTQKKWDVALNEMTLMFFAHQKKLMNLTHIFNKSRNDVADGVSRNALIMVVNFGVCDTDFRNTEDIEEELKNIKTNNIFDNCLIISARRELFTDILGFLAQEGNI